VIVVQDIHLKCVNNDEKDYHHSRFFSSNIVVMPMTTFDNVSFK